MTNTSPEHDNQPKILEPTLGDKIVFIGISYGLAASVAEGIGHYQPVISGLGTVALYDLSVYVYRKLANRPFLDETPEEQNL